MKLVPRLAAGLARLTFSPDLMMTDAECLFVAEPVPVGKRPAGYRVPVEGWLPFRKVFELLWSGRRHAMTMPTQIDRFGQINISCIGGTYEQPKAQLLGVRGIPGNTINHPCSFFVPDHSKRSFVERVTVVVGARTGATGATGSGVGSTGGGVGSRGGAARVAAAGSIVTAIINAAVSASTSQLGSRNTRCTGTPWATSISSSKR